MVNLHDSKSLNEIFYKNQSYPVRNCIDDILCKINEKIIKASSCNIPFITIFTQDFYNDMKKHKVAKKEFSTIESFILNTLKIYGYILKVNVQCEYYVSWA